MNRAPATVKIYVTVALLAFLAQFITRKTIRIDPCVTRLSGYLLLAVNLGVAATLVGIVVVAHRLYNVTPSPGILTDIAGTLLLGLSTMLALTFLPVNTSLEQATAISLLLAMLGVTGVTIIFLSIVILDLGGAIRHVPK